VTTPTAAQIGRLPKWAQAERASLLARIGELEEAYDRVMSGRLGPEGSNTSMLDENREGTLWLPEGAEVKYRLGYHKDAVVKASASPGVLRVASPSSIMVNPQSRHEVVIALLGGW